MSCYFHFTGTPCLRHTNYTFYKSFKYKLSDESKVLSLGDFFFLKILQDIPVCIGEIELLWEDKASNQLLASVRLYFRPEHTPDGRQDDTGEDEILVLGERLVLRLDDLLPLMLEDSKWEYGYQAKWPSFKSENGDLVKEKNGHKSPPPLPYKEEDLDWSVNKVDSPQSDDGDTGPAICGAANVAVMSYPRYCRYRAMMRRLEGCENKWLQLAVVMALGSFSGKGPGCRVMFCRDAFYHSEIDDLDIRMDHMMPTLKNRPRGKKKKDLSRKDSQQDSDSTEELFANVTPSVSTSSRPRRSTDTSDLNEDKVNAEEQAFLIGLHKFMHDAKIPIGRIPSLGFKQIDLYMFYKHAEKLGGYDAITTKRMWKHLYDKMGGNSSNTSAATCTRRHYERLLLPYERHLRKLKGHKSKKKTIRAIEPPDIKQEKKEEKENVSQETEVKKKKEESSVNSVKVEEKHEGEQITMAMVETPAPVQDTDGNNRAKSSSSVPANDSKNDTELLEIPIVRQRHQIPKDQVISSVDKMKESDIQSFLPQNFAALGLTEQQLMAGAIPGAVLPAEFGAAEGTVIPNTNLVYRGGYLVPLHPQQIMQTPWGIIASPQTTPVKQDVVDKAGKDQHVTPSNSNSSVIPSPARSGGKPSATKNTSSASSMDSMLFPGALSSASNNNNQQGTSSVLKAAHTNTPYQPSPYLLTDHIQHRPANPPSSSSSSSRQPHQLHLNNILANSSQNLITLLHPTPSGRKSNPNLPPAPSQVYLHPSSTNPLSPLLPSPNGAIPPPAHSQPRKRAYPFDHPSQGVFPSPDIVLDRIKSSTVLPGLNSAQGRTPVQRQRYDSPRDIFKQTKQTFAAANSQSTNFHHPHQQQHHQQQQQQHQQQQQQQQQQQHLANHQRKATHYQTDASNQKRTSSKLKSAQRKTHQQTASSSSSSSSLYHMLPPSALELQSLQMQQAVAAATNGVGGGSVRDQMKSMPSTNGLVIPDQQAMVKGMTPESQLAAAKEGHRLTSALFGTQFTAMPRPTKQSESSSMTPNSSESFPSSSAAAVAMSFNPHIHPAFMSSPYLPPGVSPAALSPQIQMQMAAYEELLRQNGYSTFLSPGGTPPAKVGKKN